MPVPRSKSDIVVVLTCLASWVMVSACATAPAPDLGSATVWGFVRLVPKIRTLGDEAGYGDRRLADVKRFDYSHVHYAVVSIPDAKNSDLSPTELTIEETSAGPRISPPFSSTHPAVGYVIRNATNHPQLVSSPQSGMLRRIDPAGQVRITDLAIGEVNLHLLSARGEHSNPAQIWVVDGRRVEVDSNGRYSIRGLGNGRYALHAWHPRLPPAPAVSVDVSVGRVHRVDLEIGVDLAKPVTEELK